MAQITKNLDQVELWDDWYEDMLDQFVEEAKEKGIQIDQRARGRHRVPEIHFSGFWSQGDGLYFEAHIDWIKFFDGHQKLKDEHLNWYLLLSANPDYASGRADGGMHRGYNQRAYVDTDLPEVIEQGFFAGTPEVDLELDIGSFEWAVQDACEAEASRMYKALEAEYEFQLEDAKERAIEDLIEDLIEEYKEPICRMLWPMMTGGEVEEDEIDLDDLENLGLIDRNGVTKKGLKVLA